MKGYGKPWKNVGINSRGSGRLLLNCSSFSKRREFSFSTPSSHHLPYPSQVSEGTRNAKGTTTFKCVVGLDLGGCWRPSGRKH